MDEGGYEVKLILEYLKRYKFWFVLNVISVFGFALVELGIPTIISYMIDQGVMNEDKGFLMKMGVLTAVISVIGVSAPFFLVTAVPGFPQGLLMISGRMFSERYRLFRTAK